MEKSDVGEKAVEGDGNAALGVAAVGRMGVDGVAFTGESIRLRGTPVAADGLCVLMRLLRRRMLGLAMSLNGDKGGKCCLPGVPIIEGNSSAVSENGSAAASPVYSVLSSVPYSEPESDMCAALL